MPEGSRQKLGQRPSWSLEAAPGGIFFEARELDSRDRFTLPAQARRGLDWLAPGGTVFGVLDEERFVRLVPWDQKTSVETRTDELRNGAESGDRGALDELIQLQATCHRLYVDPEARLELPLVLVLHLELRVSVPAAVYVVRFPQHVELWGKSMFAAMLRRSRRAADLTGTALPNT